MKKSGKFIIYAFIALGIIGTSCSNGNRPITQQETTSFTKAQEELLKNGWYIPESVPTGELPKEYGVKSKYGLQDNYFDIKIGHGYDVAIKIINFSNNQCIRYVYIPENTTANIQQIPQGRYYLKIAYGKDWMEYDNGNSTLEGKFTSKVSYDRSVEAFDFGKKNSSSNISYILHINIIESELQNNFETIPISESEFINNY